MRIAFFCPAIVTPRLYQEVDKLMNKLIEESGHYLFYVMVISGDRIGEMWAKKNGAPIEYYQGKDIDKVLKKIDYAIFVFDGSPQVKRLMMRYKMMGKHGSVIKWNTK